MTEAAIAELDIEKDGIEHEEVDLPEEEQEPEVVEHAEVSEKAEGEEEKTDPSDAEALKEAGIQPSKRFNEKSYQDRLREVLYHKHTANEEKAAAQAQLEVERQEKEALRKELEELRGGKSGSPEEELARLQAERKQAVDDDDLERVTELSDQIAELRFQRPQQPEKPRNEPEGGGGEPQRKLNEHTKTWLDRNDWYKDEQNAHLAREAEFIEAELRQEGFGFSEAMYQELDRRLQRLPDFDGVMEQGGKPKPRVAQPSRGGEPPSKPKAGQLTDYDLKVMGETPGLDPNNPAHRKAYLKYKGK